MISVKQALEMALTTQLNVNEQKAYDAIVSYIDNKIKNEFNGKSISFKIEGETITGSSYVFHISNYTSKSWRQEIITNKWKEAYQSGSWRIEEVEVPDYYGKKIMKYTLSVDPSYNRDKRLDQILG